MPSRFEPSHHRVAQRDHGLLADLDQVAEVVRDEVAHDDGHQRVGEQARHVPVRQPGHRGVSMVAQAKRAPTSAEASSAERVQQHPVDAAVWLCGPRSATPGSCRRRCCRAGCRPAAAVRRPAGGRRGSATGTRTTSVPSSRRPKHDEPADEGRVRLERVGRGDPALAEDRRADQHHGGVHREPETHRGEVARLGVDQLQPDEREHAERRRPQSRPRTGAARRPRRGPRR